MFGIYKLFDLARQVDALRDDLRALKKQVEGIAERVEELDPNHQRAVQAKTFQQVAFMMDRFDELAFKILQRESATKRWSKQREEENAQLDLLRAMAQSAQTAPAPAPAPAPAMPTTPKNGVR